MAGKHSAAELKTSALTPDLDEVRRFIVEMIKQGSIAELLTAVLSLLTRMRELNAELMRKLAASRRKRPPNETMRRLQMELPFLSAQAQNDGGDGAEQAEPNKAKPKQEKKKRGPKNPDRHGRPKLPEHLPRVMAPVQRVADGQRICPHCNVEAALVTHKCARKLDVEPARFVVRVESREVLACQQCHDYVVTAPKQDEVVDRGILGNELLVQATVDHYQDAIPWERMQNRARQQGVPLCANTLAKSCGALIDLFDPIVQYIFQRCVSSGYFAFDATTMPVLDIEAPVGIRTGALWLLQGDHCFSYFMYANSGHAHHLEAKLKGYKLASAMCDGSPTNNVVERAGGSRGGCNAHARRKLVEALRLGDQRALGGLEIYAGLFHVEAESKRAGESIAQRFERRQRDSAPLVAQLSQWVKEQLLTVEPKSKLGKALRYMKRQWKRLTKFMHDPRMELTNNEVERDLRTWVLDRKTWLFCGHDDSARRAADALTIITTCKKLGIDPRSYIRDTLERILAGEKDLASLLPENYKPAAAEPSTAHSSDLAA